MSTKKLPKTHDERQALNMPCFCKRCGSHLPEGAPRMTALAARAFYTGQFDYDSPLQLNTVTEEMVLRAEARAEAAEWLVSETEWARVWGK